MGFDWLAPPTRKHEGPITRTGWQKKERGSNYLTSMVGDGVSCSVRKSSVRAYIVSSGGLDCTREALGWVNTTWDHDNKMDLDSILRRAIFYSSTIHRFLSDELFGS